MKQNVGKIDRSIRIVVGLGIITWGITTQSWLGAIGVVPLLTGLLRWCPAYCPIGVSIDDKTSCN